MASTHARARRQRSSDARAYQGLPEPHSVYLYGANINRRAKDYLDKAVFKDIMKRIVAPPNDAQVGGAGFAGGRAYRRILPMKRR